MFLAGYGNNPFPLMYCIIRRRIMASSDNRIRIIVAIIGMFGAVIAAIIGGLFLIQASKIKIESQTTATALAQITQPPLPTYSPLSALPTYTLLPTDTSQP
jgi:hypothetical protein